MCWFWNFGRNAAGALSVLTLCMKIRWFKTFNRYTLKTLFDTKSYFVCESLYFRKIMQIACFFCLWTFFCLFLSYLPMLNWHNLCMCKYSQGCYPEIPGSFRGTGKNILALAVWTQLGFMGILSPIVGSRAEALAI